MKLNFGSEVIMLIFILGLAFFTVIQPTFYPSYSTPPPASPPGVPTPTPTPPPAGGQNPAFFTITPSTQTLTKGETLTLSLTLTTGDFEIDSVDLVLNFNPMFFKINSVQKGNIFSQYPVQKIEGDKIRVSAIAFEEIIGGGSGFKGEGKYARIVFQALETTDSTQVSFVGGDKGSKAVSVDTDRLDLNKCQPGNYKITD